MCIRDSSSTTINATNIDLAALASSVLSAVLNDLLGNVISTDNRELAATLVGGSATNAGKSIADVLAGLKSDADKLKTGPIGGLLGGTLQLVGNLLGGVVTIVADTTCNLSGLFDQGKIRECRINYIAANALGGASGGTNAGLQTIVMTLLTPVLNTLSLVLNQALNVLGVSIGQTDVSLLSVDCGKPRLVY